MDILLNTENREIVNLLIVYLEKQSNLHVKDVEEPFNVEVLDYGFLYKMDSQLLKFVYVADLFNLFKGRGQLTSDIKNNQFVFND